MAIKKSSKPKKAARDQERVAVKLHSAAIHLLRYLRTQDRLLGLPPARLSALSVIVFGGPQSVGSLCEAEQVQPPTMSRIIDALVEEKLVKREEDPEDRRAVRISATKKGEQLMRRGQGRRVKSFVKLIESLADDRLATLDAAADILTDLLTPSRGVNTEK